MRQPTSGQRTLVLPDAKSWPCGSNSVCLSPSSRAPEGARRCRLGLSRRPGTQGQSSHPTPIETIPPEGGQELRAEAPPTLIEVVERSPSLSADAGRDRPRRRVQQPSLMRSDDAACARVCAVTPALRSAAGTAATSAPGGHTSYRDQLPARAHAAPIAHLCASTPRRGLAAPLVEMRPQGRLVARAPHWTTAVPPTRPSPISGRTVSAAASTRP